VVFVVLRLGHYRIAQVIAVGRGAMIPPLDTGEEELEHPACVAEAIKRLSGH
jgi:hypothetical protein